MGKGQCCRDNLNRMVMRIIWKYIVSLFSYSVLRPYYKNSVGFIGLQGHENVLDFGCGVGASSLFILKRLHKPGARVTCVDVSKAAVGVAKHKLRKYKNVTFLHGDIREMGLESNTFDVIYMSFVLYHIKPNEREKVLKELKRLLKEGGRLIFVTSIDKKGYTYEYIEGLMSKCGFSKKGTAFFRALNIFPSYRGIFQ